MSYVFGGITRWELLTFSVFPINFIKLPSQFVLSEKDVIFANERVILTAWQRKTEKFARLLTRYRYFSNNSLRVYSSIG